MRLLSALHARGMTLPLDAVLTHISASHPWFVASQNGDARMPELNLANPEVPDVLYRRQDSLVQHRLARDMAMCAGKRFTDAGLMGRR